jgi:mono/diheme cytochrome c family protein
MSARAISGRVAWIGTMTAALGLMIWVTGSSGVSAQAGAAPAAPKKVAAARPAGGGVVSAARGKYLVDAAGCHDCHTPHKMGPDGPEPDMSLSLSGHPAGMVLPPPPQMTGPWMFAGIGPFTAWAGPWGISYTKNLTPDKETGLGSWTEQQFVETIRNGREQGRGRQLLPPMPWPAIRTLNDADLKSIFAYLKTIPAIKNKVPDPVIAPPPPSK